MKDTLEKLENRAYMSAKCRFNASNRLKIKQKLFVFGITFLTCIQICITLALILNTQHSLSSILTCLTLYCSVFIAIISNTDSFSKDILRAYQFHECGKKLIELARKISQESDESNLVNLQKEYDDIFREYHDNHEAIDHALATTDTDPNICCIVKRWVKIKFLFFAVFTPLVYALILTSTLYVTYLIFK